MAHPSQTTLRIALKEFASFQADAQGPVAFTPEQTLIAAGATNSVTGGVFYVYVVIGTDYANGQFLREGIDWTKKDVGGGGYDLSLRKPLGYVANVYYGGCDAPDFVVPNGCRSVVMTQAAATGSNPYYFRQGTANRFGLPIGKEADANTSDVQGTFVAHANISTELDEWEPGTPVYLLASGASQVVVVQFNKSA